MSLSIVAGAERTSEQTVVFTDTGRNMNMFSSSGDYETVSLNGAWVSVRHFIVNKRQEVWLDKREIPIKFRTVEDGTPIDFVLKTAPAARGSPVVILARRKPLLDAKVAASKPRRRRASREARGNAESPV
jgi:hypothetical protein